MTKRLRIYIAGPYTPRDCGLHDAAVVVQRNVDRAILAAWEVIRRGHLPYVSHLTHYLHLRTPENMSPLPQDFWYEYDLTWLEACDAILMLPGWTRSRGATLEHDHALRRGMRVFYGVEEVPHAGQEG